MRLQRPNLAACCARLLFLAALALGGSGCGLTPVGFEIRGPGPDAGRWEDAGQLPDGSPGEDAAAGPDADGGSPHDPDASPGEADGSFAQADGSLPCVVPAAGMVITASATLCAGTYSLPVEDGEAALSVEADAVTLTCLGTVLDGAGAFGTETSPTAGIAIGAVQGVTVEGCTVRGYRHGISALGSGNLTLRAVVADDNFTDPAAGWVEDKMQGGGILLRQVHVGLVEDSSFSRNWNGIELRDSSAVRVTRNVGSHCSNAGAFLWGSYDKELSDNDFSWGLRGGLTWPSHWYDVDTKDAAGVILDGSSHHNSILRNDCTHGGDGIFLRGLAGCSNDNLVAGNDVSFSPHNGIESWCERNTIEGNTARECNFGIWTGGSDHVVIRGNVVTGSKADGISAQIAESRHGLIEDNQISGSARVGLLLSGREYQKGTPLTAWSAQAANVSHLVVQRNTFSGNGAADIFTSSSRLVALASNCGEGGGPPDLLQGGESELLPIVGTCGGATGRVPPAAALADPGAVPVGTLVQLDGSASAPSPQGGALSFSWLVQPALPRFPEGTLPAAPLAQLGGTSTPSLTLTAPGVYQADLIVDDGFLAAGATRSLFVLPAGGFRVGEVAAHWTWACAGMSPPCVTTVEDEPLGVEGSCVHVATDAAFDFAAIAPATRDLGLDARGFSRLGFFISARNDNPHVWQGNYPSVVLATGSGTIAYAPAVNLLPGSPEWLWLELPLGGGSGWTQTTQGSIDLSHIDWIEIHADTWGYQGFELWLDVVVFY